MKAPRLIAISDVARYGIEHTLGRLERLAASLPEDTVLLMLRDRGLPGARRLELGRGMLRLAREHGQRLCVNDRLDLARFLEADAVHLGEQGVRIQDARRLLGDGVWLSVAIHAPTADTKGADAALLSPVIKARKGNDALGVAALTQAAAQGTPVYALGGVGATEVASCLAAGAAGVAAIGAIFDAGPLEPLIEAVRDGLATKPGPSSDS